MEKKIDVVELAAQQLRDEPFLKFFIPIVTVVGCGTLLYFGFKGIVKKETRRLWRLTGSSFIDAGRKKYYGNTAIIFGISYVLLGIFLAAFLVPLSYKIWLPN